MTQKQKITPYQVERTTTPIRLHTFGDANIVATINEHNMLEAITQPFAAMYGYTTAELVGRPVVDLFVADAKADLLDYIEQTRHQKNSTFQADLRHKDGTTFPVLINLLSTRQNEGHPAASLTIMIQGLVKAEQDGTRQANYEWMIHDAARCNTCSITSMLHHYEAIINNTPDLMSLLDKNLIYVAVNDAYLHAHQKERSDILGQSVADLLGQEKFERLLQDKLHRCLAGETIRYDTWFDFPGLGQRYMNVVYTPLAENGSITGVISVMSDKTEQSQTELALQKSNHKLAEAQRIANLGSWELDLASGELTWSDEIYRIFGLKPQEFAATYEAFLETIHPDDLEAVNTAYTKSVEDDTPYDITHRIIRKKTGEVRMVHEHCEHLRNEDGVIIRSQGTVQDITARKQVEDELKEYREHLEVIVAERTAQLESVNKELEAFAYSVSHDLRAPLRAVSGFAQILARRHRPDLNEEGQHYMDNIVLASKRMGELIDDLLTYSRIGRRAIELQPIALTDILMQVQQDLLEQITKTQATLSLPESLPPVQGHSTLLQQIFTNILGNALIYHHPDIPPQISVTCQTEGKHLIVSIADNGIGIAPEFHDKIFQVFQRLHASEQYPGTGIGLAIVKKSLALLDGDIWVESAVGQGTTFYIKLQKGLL